MRELAAVAAALLLAGCNGLEALDPTSPVGPKAYLTDRYDTWVIEVDLQTGTNLRPGTEAALESRLAEVVNKSGIEFRHGTLPNTGDRHTRDSLLDLHADTLGERTGGGQVVTHVLVVKGSYQSDAQEGGEVLGVTIGHGLVVLFDDHIEGACTPLRLCLLDSDEVEKAVAIHEFGHVLGLVNNGTPMQSPHEDPDCDGHSSNPDSVMACSLDSSVAIAGLDRIPTTFDADDRSDLRGNGGR